MRSEADGDFLKLGLKNLKVEILACGFCSYLRLSRE